MTVPAPNSLVSIDESRSNTPHCPPIYNNDIQLLIPKTKIKYDDLIKMTHVNNTLSNCNSANNTSSQNFLPKLKNQPYLVTSNVNQHSVLAKTHTSQRYKEKSNETSERKRPITRSDRLHETNRPVKFTVNEIKQNSKDSTMITHIKLMDWLSDFRSLIGLSMDECRDSSSVPSDTLNMLDSISCSTEARCYAVHLDIYCYNPYDLTIVDHDRATSSFSTYYTSSPTHLLQFVEGKLNGVISVERWLWERKMFYQLKKLNYFSQAKIRFAFQSWLKYYRHIKIERVKSYLLKNLYQVRPAYQQTLIDIFGYLFSLCPISEDLFNNPLRHLKGHHLKLFWVNLLNARKLEQLEEECKQNFINVDSKISHVKQEVIKKLLDFSLEIENSVDANDYPTSIKKKVVIRDDKLRCKYEVFDERDRVVSKFEVVGDNLDCTNEVIEERTPENAKRYKEKYLEPITKPKVLRDLAPFFKLIDLILRQFLRELSLIGASTIKSLIHTCISDSHHHSHIQEEENQFRRMVVGLNELRRKRSIQLSDIMSGMSTSSTSHQHITESDSITSSRRVKKRYYVLGHEELKRNAYVHQIPTSVIRLTDDFKASSPALLRVSLILKNNTSRKVSILRDVAPHFFPRRGSEGSKDTPKTYKLVLKPSISKITEFFRKLYTKIWSYVTNYDSILDDPALEAYAKQLSSILNISDILDESHITPEKSGLLPLLDKIEPSNVNMYVEFNTHIQEIEMATQINASNNYEFSLEFYNLNSTENKETIDNLDKNSLNTDSIFSDFYNNEDYYEQLMRDSWSETIFQIDTNYDEVSIYRDAFDPYCVILDQFTKVKTHAEEQNGSWDSKKFWHYLDFVASQGEALKLMVPTFRIGPFNVDSLSFYESSQPCLKEILQTLNDNLKKDTCALSKELQEDMKEAYSNLHIISGDIKSHANHLIYLSHIGPYITSIDSRSKQVVEYCKIINDYNLEFDSEDLMKIRTLQPELDILNDYVKRFTALKETTISTFVSLLQIKLKNISEKREEISTQLSSSYYLQEASGYETVLIDLRYILVEAQSLIEQTEEIQIYIQTFANENIATKLHRDNAYISNIHKALNQLKSDILLKQLLWKASKDWQTSISRWNVKELNVLDIQEIQTKIGFFMQLQVLFHRELPQNSLWRKTYLAIRKFSDLLPVLSVLVSPSLKKRHKVKIDHMLVTDFDSGQITLEELMKFDLLAHKEAILEIGSLAEQERRLEDLFLSVTNPWLTEEFSLIRHADVFLITNVEKLFVMLDDSQINLNVIKQSNFIGPIKAEVDNWDSKIIQMKRTLEIWSQCQKIWRSLESIFSTLDSKHELMFTSRDFNKIDKFLQDFSSTHFSSNGANVMHITTKPGIFEIFESYNIQLEGISRSLDNYLENKRHSFARFFFLSREELLTIICHPNDPSYILPYLSKLFGSVQQLQLVKNLNTDILNVSAVVSNEGEVVKLNRHVPAKNSLSKWWIGYLEEGLQNTVKKSITIALYDYSNQLTDDWLYGMSGQATLIALLVSWTYEVECALSIFDEEGRDGTQELSQLSLKWHNNILKVAESLNYPRKHCHQLLGVSIVTILIYCRDVLKRLSDLPDMQGPSDYNWAKILRYYYNKSREIVQVEHLMTKFRYYNEYLGCSPRLVVTPLTERAYLHMSMAIHFNMGTALFGYPGTGKTETVKDFAKAVGNIYFSYNCTAESDSRMLTQYLFGICCSGAWGCFDEFHKLDLETLSVVYHNMQMIKLAKDAKKCSLHISHRETTIYPQSNYFITLNFEECSSMNISDVLRGTLRPCAMMHPDKLVITEVLLYASGFTTAEKLARKITSLWKYAEENLTEQCHYNFGLRTIVQVVNLAADRRKNFYINWKEVCVPLARVESLLLTRTIQDTVVPRLLNADLTIFQRLLADHFIGLQQVTPDNSYLESVIVKVFQELDLIIWKPQVQKVVELSLLVKQSPGIILVGSAGCGKSVLLDVLARTMNNLYHQQQPSGTYSPNRRDSIFSTTHVDLSNSIASNTQTTSGTFSKFQGSKVSVAKINAKSFTLEELYGTYTLEENTAILPVILKSYLNDLQIFDDSNEKKRSCRLSRIELRELLFESACVIYKPRDEEVDDKGIPMIDATSQNPKHTEANQLTNNENSEKGTFSDWRWIIMSGPMDSVWVDHLNSALDDSKMVSLCTGERLKISEGLRFIFETESLLSANPATVSRCSVVFVEQKDLGWEPLVQSWLASLPIEFPHHAQDYIYLLFEHTIQPAIDFISNLTDNPLSLIPPIGYINTLCNILTCFILHLIENRTFSDDPDTISTGKIRSHHIRSSSLPSVSNSFSEQTPQHTGALDKRAALAKVFEQEEDVNSFISGTIEHDLVLTIKSLPNDLTDCIRNSCLPHTTLTYLQKNPGELLNVLGRLYVFAYVWAFGGPLNSFDLDEFLAEAQSFEYENLFIRGGLSGKAKFDRFVYELFLKEGPHKVTLPNAPRPIFSYYVDLNTGQFALWSDLIPTVDEIIDGIPHPSFQLASDKTTLYHLLVNDLGLVHPTNFELPLVPTLDVVRTIFFNVLLGARYFPVLLAGSHVAGTTMLMKKSLDLLTSANKHIHLLSAILGGESIPNTFDRVFIEAKEEEIENQFTKSMIKLSLNMSPATLQQLIVENLVKKGRTKYCGILNKRVLLMLDDLNAPETDEFNHSHCLELVTSLMDEAGLFERRSVKWREVYDLTLMSTYRLSSASLDKISGRLLRHFHCFHVQNPSQINIKHIFGVTVNMFFKKQSFDQEMIFKANHVASAICYIYEQMNIKFKPTPATPHYLFSIRDLTHIFTGISQCSTNSIKTVGDLINLTSHECNRVLHDRLKTEIDITTYFEIMKDALDLYFMVVKSPISLRHDEVLFGDFSDTSTDLSCSYQPLPPQKKIVAELDKYFMRGPESADYDSPILFGVTLAHIMRICRIFRMPARHMLMLGLPATGKRSSLRLACSLSGFNLVMAHKEWEQNSPGHFESDMKLMIREAGLKGVKSALYIPASLLSQAPHMVSMIANIITQGCTKQLFQLEEIQDIEKDMGCYGLINMSTDPSNSNWNLFAQNVNLNLHIFISITPASRMLQVISREYPDILSHIFINWFSEWPSDALGSVAKKFLSRLELEKPLAPSMLNVVSDCCSKIHHHAVTCTNELEEEKYWKSYVTTVSYMAMLKLLVYTTNHQCSKYKSRLHELENAMKRLEEIDQEIIDISENIELGTARLDEKKLEVASMLSTIEKAKKDITKQKRKKELIEEDISKRSITLRILQNKATEAYDSVKPLLDEAINEIKLLNRSEITELRNYHNPPEIVVQVMLALCVIFKRQVDLHSAKQFLSEPNFLATLKSFAIEHLSDEIRNKLKNFTSDSRFHPSNAGKISGACKSLCKWIFAIEHYIEVYMDVAPKKQDYFTSLKYYQNASNDRDKNHTVLQSLDAKLTKYNASQTQYLNEEVHLADRLQSLKIKRQDAHTLKNCLEAELEASKEKKSKLILNIRNVLGDCLISSAGIAYLGPLPFRYRQLLISKWLDVCRIGYIPLSLNYSFSHHHFSEEVFNIWFSLGLPKDAGSVQNAVLIETGYRWPLIIDPQQLATKWIIAKERENNLIICDYADTRVVQILSEALKANRPILVRDVPETFAISLEDVFFRELSRELKDGVPSENLEIEPKKSAFKLYMTCNQSYPKFAAEVYIRASVVNFSISEESMEDLLAAEAVSLQNPIFEKQRVLLIHNLSKNYKELWSLQDNFYLLLKSCFHDILNCEQSMKAIFEYREKREKILNRVEAIQKAQNEINEEKNSYTRIAKRGSLLYNIACDLNMFDRMYQFSINWFLDLYRSCFIRVYTRMRTSSSTSLQADLDAIKRDCSYEPSKEKIETILQKLTYTFYNQVGKAIFSKYLLPFSLTLCGKLLMEGNISVHITGNEWGYFLFGKHSNTLNKSHTTSMLALTSSLHTIKTSKFSENIRHTSTSFSVDTPPSSIPQLTPELWKQCEELERLLPSAFRSLRHHILLNSRLWVGFLVHSDPITYDFKLPVSAQNTTGLGIISEESEHSSAEYIRVRRMSRDHHSKLGKSFECEFYPEELTLFQKLILIKTIRKNLLIKSIIYFISKTIGPEYTQTPVLDLKEAFEKSNNLMPILLIFPEDAEVEEDIVEDIEALAREKFGPNSELYQLIFDKNTLSRQFITLKRLCFVGTWVLCSNAHDNIQPLCQILEYMQELGLENKLNVNFRLWMTTRSHPEFPTTILHASLKLRVEALTNLKVSIQQSLFNRGAVSAEVIEGKGAGVNWKKIIFNLCFFNASVRCRNRYDILGWNYNYNFSIHDFKAAITILRKIMTDHKNTPWESIVSAVGEICYGGRILDQIDKKRINYILKGFFNSHITQRTYTIFKNTLNIKMIDEKTTFEQWQSCIACLPDIDPPEVLGMNASADVLYNIKNTESLLKYIEKMNATPWEGQEKPGLIHYYEKSHYLHRTDDSLSFNENPKWYDRLLPLNDIKLHLLNFNLLPEEIKTPLTIVLIRELESYHKLLSKIFHCMKELAEAKDGFTLASVEREELQASLYNNEVPKMWKDFCYPTTCSLTSFVKDLKNRVEFFLKWQNLFIFPRRLNIDKNETLSDFTIELLKTRPRSFWLGAFFKPRCFLSALLQEYSQINKIELHNVFLETRVTNEKPITLDAIFSDNSDFDLNASYSSGSEAVNGAFVHGFYLQGCSYDRHQGLMNIIGKSVITRLPPVHFIPSDYNRVLRSRTRVVFKTPVYYTDQRSRYHSTSSDLVEVDTNIITYISLQSHESSEHWLLSSAAILLSPPKIL